MCIRDSVRGVPKRARDACGRSHKGLRWSSLWGREACEECANMGAGRMGTQPQGPSVEFPMGPRSV
eukprot:7388419-Pyramimonas_sp.AAC.1